MVFRRAVMARLQYAVGSLCVNFNYGTLREFMRHFAYFTGIAVEFGRSRSGTCWAPRMYAWSTAYFSRARYRAANRLSDATRRRDVKELGLSRSRALNISEETTPEETFSSRFARLKSSVLRLRYISRSFSIDRRTRSVA